MIFLTVIENNTEPKKIEARINLEDIRLKLY